MKKINVFYTGGFDSTYMLIVLLRKGYIVQPIYALDHGRNSLEIELNTIEKILSKLKEKKDFKNKILPLIKVDLNDLIIPNDVEQALNFIRKDIQLGSQYSWLSVIANNYGLVGAGIEKPNGEFGGCSAVIEKYGKLIKKDNFLVIDQHASSKECNILFKNLFFPIIDTTENEMVKNIENWGLQDIMKLIWFCYTPINNLPCGLCRPCEQKIESNMKFLLPEKALKRYDFYHWCLKKIPLIGKVYKKVVIHFR